MGILEPQESIEGGITSALAHSLEEIVLAGFCMVTERLAGIHMIKTEESGWSGEAVYSGMIGISGKLVGRMLFIMPESMADQIVFEMNHRKELSKEQEEEYFREYLNIVAGRTMTEIGNFLGCRMRFSVPVVREGINEDIIKAMFRYRIIYNFSSELGKVHFILEYDSAAAFESAT